MGSFDLSRLLQPKSIAVLGGSWARSVVAQCRRMNFAGDIWPVHPQRTEFDGLPCFSSIANLPGAPDACFVGINRFATIGAVKELRTSGAGGVVCFASGFSEAAKEDKQAKELQRELLQAAGDMPLIGPNCYGLINYLDGALLWPDQHGGERVESGVAIITQSSNIAINLTMQRRALPIAYVLTAGNQAQLSIGELGSATLEDPRVTALALHIEGFGDIPAFEEMAQRAQALGKPIVVLKVGRSELSQTAMISHTSSLSGSDSAADAFLLRLGIARVYSLSVMIETLKLLHVTGPLNGTSIHSMSCSGGEASLMADAAVDSDVNYPALSERQIRELRAALGPLVALANPLDYHTFIWDDLDAMTATFTAMLSGDADLSLLVLDFPRDDRCDHSSWHSAIEAFRVARDVTGVNAAIVATLPENLPESIARDLIAQRIVPLCGVEDAMQAIGAACTKAMQFPEPTLVLDVLKTPSIVHSEADTKLHLRDAGVMVPQGAIASSLESIDEALQELKFPVVLKGIGLVHKSDSAAVVTELVSAEAVYQSALRMQRLTAGKINSFLLEEFVDNCVAELLISVVRDRTHGLQLTIAAGGVMTELLADARHLLLPCTRKQILAELESLRIYRVLQGFRGQAGADVDAILDAVMAIQAFALKLSDSLYELEVNPLLCTENAAYAVDALLRTTATEI